MGGGGAEGWRGRKLHLLLEEACCGDTAALLLKRAAGGRKEAKDVGCTHSFAFYCAPSVPLEHCNMPKKIVQEKFIPPVLNCRRRL